MAKRLEVVVQDSEYRKIRRMARSRHMSIAEWVRQALQLARRRESLGDIGKKLDVIRAATQNDYPSGDIDVILAEIASRYGAGPQDRLHPGL
jgi:hypothetical protein